MARLCTLASGSAGNSTYISTGSADILIDVGLSYAKTLAAIESAGGDISKIGAVAVTHTHIDHIKGLKVFLKNTHIPVMASDKTLDTLAANNILPEGIKTISAQNGSVQIGDVSVDFFETSHDCDGSGGYTVTLPDGRKTAVCTDLGVVGGTVKKFLLGSSAVLIESNHDIEMLKHGPYPAALKLRIMSDYGHLSNGAAAAELPSLLNSGTTRIILGHLSMQNNTPVLARSSATSALASIGAKDGSDYILEVAKPNTVGVTVF